MLRLALCAFLVQASLAVSAVELSGQVVGVHDGDTITVLDVSKTQYKIRLAGIDAPELKQAFGSRSKQNLSDLVYHKQVTVEWIKRDRYGRIIGKVLFIPESCISPACLEKTDANYQQVAAGMAWHYKKYEREQSLEDRQRYAAAESQARAAKRGLWAEENPMPPWERRHSKQR
ncbi:MAG: nuclease [Betaproteobacteria bacterium]|nr:nuclease [Betaproteobacteria bacterium]